MKEPNAPPRYGEALLNAAEKANAVQEALEAARALSALIRQQPQLLAFLGIPQVSRQQKKEVLQQAFQAGVPPVLLDFLYLLVDRQRTDDLPEIIEAFEMAYDRRRGIQPIEVRTAVPMPGDLRAALEEKLRQAAGGEVRVSYEVQPELLGGVLLLWGETGTDVDGTVRRRLNQISDSLRNVKVH